MAMASTWSCLLVSLPVCSSRTTQGLCESISGNNTSFLVYGSSYESSSSRRQLVVAKADPDDQKPERKSVICTNCDGNGAVLCSQCKGSGVNSVDVFGGRFKAGDSCWLCGGKKDMLCGDCNGAGFIGGFMSTFDE